MDSEDLRRLRAVGSQATFPAGQVVIERGQYGGGLYVILEGTVVIEAPEGILECGSGSVIGERALLSRAGTRAARVRAASDLCVLAVNRLEFERLCADDAAFAERMASLASGAAKGARGQHQDASPRPPAATRDFDARS